MSRRSRKSPRLTKLRYAVEAGLMRTMMGLFKVLGPDRASNLGGAIMRLVGPRLGTSGTARNNLRRAMPELTEDQIETIVKDSWENLGRVAGEFPHIEWIINNRVKVHGIERVHALRDDGQGGIIISAHLANWEIGAALMAQQGLDIAVVYRAANNPGVEEIYTKAREAFGQSQQITKGRTGARKIMALLKRGGHVGMLVDQKLSNGIPVPFFGIDAMTAHATAKCALHFRCPLVPARAIRTHGCNFEVFFGDPLELPDSGDAEADAYQVMVTVNQMMEGWIRANPGQWMWMHKRWPNSKRRNA